MDSSAQWKKRRLHQSTLRSASKIVKAAQLVGQLDHWQRVHQMMRKLSRRTNVECPCSIQHCLPHTGGFQIAVLSLQIHVVQQVEAVAASALLVPFRPEPPHLPGSCGFIRWIGVHQQITCKGLASKDWKIKEITLKFTRLLKCSPESNPNSPLPVIATVGQYPTVGSWTDGRFGQEILFFCSNCQLTSDIAIRHQWHQLSITAQLNGGIFEKLAEKKHGFVEKGDSKGR